MIARRLFLLFNRSLGNGPLVAEQAAISGEAERFSARDHYEAYVVGHSDPDAMWYYERCRRQG